MATHCDRSFLVCGSIDSIEIGIERRLDVDDEISAVWQGGSVHVLGYFMDPKHPRLIEELSAILDDREWRAKGMIEKLNALGVPVTFEQVRAPVHE